jgi:hypothetical protein
MAAQEPPLATTILDRWTITPENLTRAIDENPSLRGMLFGYVAEYKLRELWFKDRPSVSHFVKHDDHNRKKKGDLVVTYKRHPFTIECKSLQTNSIQQEEGGQFVGKVQCDASDRRPVTFPDKTKLETTCLLRGEFDILAVNLFAFDGKWRFAFAKNKDLPRNTFKKYTPAQQALLLPSLLPVSWPLTSPYRDEPFSLMDELIAEADC